MRIHPLNIHLICKSSKDIQSQQNDIKKDCKNILSISIVVLSNFLIVANVNAIRVSIKTHRGQGCQREKKEKEKRRKCYTC